MSFPFIGAARRARHPANLIRGGLPRRGRPTGGRGGARCPRVVVPELSLHAMRNVQARDYLCDQHGLIMSPLKALVPDESLYELLLIQPSGKITAGSDGVRNSDAATAAGKFKDFLIRASNLKVDLAVAPEYSCPWVVVEESINAGRVPGEGALWLLGCESITPEGLAELAGRCGGVKWVYEPVAATATAKFLDPVYYLFRASDVSGRSQVVALVQFKGQLMSDHKSYIERDNQTSAILF
jgi:hypothetical protein